MKGGEHVDQSEQEAQAKRYRSLMNVTSQVNLNLAFDELVERVLSEKPTASINVSVGRVTGKFDPETRRYSFTL